MTNQLETKTYRISRRFWRDHQSRDLNTEVTMLPNPSNIYATVILDREAYDELMSDAEYYRDCAVQEMGREYANLADSARVTAIILNEEGAPEA